ncbi:hypothetical protein [Spirosoma sp.]|uniref:hypothetical protein n=1 Tax=Spirosoma sp. TaxID=1899569 RepID=UPI003B3B0FD1
MAVAFSSVGLAQPAACNEPATYNYVSVANGSWTAGSTWAGGSAPPVTVSGSTRILITHSVSYASAELIFQSTAVVTVKNGGHLDAKQIQLEGSSRLIVDHATITANAGNLGVKASSFFCAKYACINVGENLQIADATAGAYFQSSGARIGYNTSGNFQSVGTITGSDLRIWLPNGNLQKDGGTWDGGMISAYRVSQNIQGFSGTNAIEVSETGTDAAIESVITPCDDVFTITVSGLVWHDADGNLAQNGSEPGTNAGGPLYVNLVDATNTVLASTLVSASGTYSLTNVPASTTGLKLVLTSSASSTTPGTLPTNWVNTGEPASVGNGATQSATLGLIELTTATTPITSQNFGIEPRPLPGSGSVTVANPGGTSPVSVPPTAFTNTTPSTDTAPGSVTAIRVTSFPTNLTSLTINGAVYTAATFPPAGVVVPTNATGAPTVPIEVDPTNDSSPVVFTFTAIDNAGKESIPTGTATINFVAPDLSPVIYARPSTTYNTKPINVVVEVYELNNAATSGLITVLLAKDTKVNLSFTSEANNVGGQTVNNSVWSFDPVSNLDYYVLTTNEVVGAGNLLAFGLSGTLTPGATSGTLTFTTVIAPGSGGEVRITNNTDADKIDFFQQ